MEFLTITNILFLITLGTVGFNVYLSLKKPQEKLEKDQIADKLTATNKESALAQQVEWQKEATASRFKELQDSFYEILKVNQNHLHTLETKLDRHIDDNVNANLENAKTLSRIETLLTAHLK